MKVKRIIIQSFIDITCSKKQLHIISVLFHLQSSYIHASFHTWQKNLYIFSQHTDEVRICSEAGADFTTCSPYLR